MPRDISTLSSGQIEPALASTSLTCSEPKIDELPVRVARPTGAMLVTRYFFPVSPRTLEAWPLTVRHVNGKALIDTSELFAVAQSKLDASLPLKGGRTPKASIRTAS